jgi:hypothetical protein
MQSYTYKNKILPTFLIPAPFVQVLDLKNEGIIWNELKIINNTDADVLIYIIDENIDPYIDEHGTLLKARQEAVFENSVPKNKIQYKFPPFTAGNLLIQYVE